MEKFLVYQTEELHLFHEVCFQPLSKGNNKKDAKLKFPFITSFNIPLPFLQFI